MTIQRKAITSEQPFTVFSNELLNTKMSAEALGVLVFLISKPSNWKVLPGPLGKQFGCGRDKIYRIMGELIELGYATREADRDYVGKITGWNYLVSNEKQPLPEKPEVESEPLPEKATSGESAPQKKDNSKKERLDSYSEEFESLWQQYPRTRNTSKKKAWDYYRMLNAEKQQKVRAAVPIFAAAMRAEGRPEDKIAHMTTWLNGRMYETVAAPASASSKPEVPWFKTATREQWGKVLNIWSGTNNWSQSWGPEPGKPGCAIPADMIAAHNVKHRGFMFSEEQLAEFRKIVSKHAVDTTENA